MRQRADHRHRAGALTRDHHHGRADHRARRRRAARDPDGDHARCATSCFAVIFITHDLSLLLELGRHDRDHVRRAHRRAGARSDELADAAAPPVQLRPAALLPELHGPRRTMLGIPGAPPDLRDVPPGCAFHPRCPFAFDACSHDRAALAPRQPRRAPEAISGRLPSLRPRAHARAADRGTDSRRLRRAGEGSSRHAIRWTASSGCGTG